MQIWETLIPKYKINDDVYVIQEIEKKNVHTCSECKHHVNTTINKEWKFNCYYTFKISSIHIHYDYNLEEFIITYDLAEKIIYDDNDIDRYYIEDGNEWNTKYLINVSENDLFLELKDAINECDKRNNKNNNEKGNK